MIERAGGMGANGAWGVVRVTSKEDELVVVSNGQTRERESGRSYVIQTGQTSGVGVMCVSVCGR